MIADLRWFAPNRYCALPVARLRALGWTIAEDGDAPARFTVAADGQCAVDGFAFSRRHRTPFALYVWDLPPWRLGEGRPDPVFAVGPRLIRVPRPVGGYRERAGYYGRIRAAARRADAVWCPSGHTMADVTRHFGVHATRLPFCYDSDRFVAPVTRTPGTPPVILSISRLVPSKDHATLIRAAAQLATPVTLHLIGRGPEAGPLRALADRLGVTLRLDDGWASDDEIVAAYRGADVVACPSHFEGFGLTPIEGLAMGCRVVASDIPTHREFVGERVGLFPAGDDAALATRLDEALTEARAKGPAPARPTEALSIEACARRFDRALRALHLTPSGPPQHP